MIAVYYYAAKDYRKDWKYQIGKRVLVSRSLFEWQAYGKPGYYGNLQLCDMFGHVINYRLAFDIDNDCPKEALRQARLLYNLLAHNFNAYFIDIHFTGNRGYHIEVKTMPGYLDVFESFTMAYNPKLLHLAWKNLAKNCMKKLETFKLKVDTSIYNGGMGRPFRIEGTQHRKTDLFKIPLTQQELLELTYQQIRMLARCPRKVESPYFLLDVPTQMAMCQAHKLRLRQCAEIFKAEPFKATPLREGAMSRALNRAFNIFRLKLVDETDAYYKFKCPQCLDSTVFFYKNGKSYSANCSHETCHCKMKLIYN